MVKENLYQAFDIAYKVLDECPKKEHQHSFFELVYIVEGTGMQCINKKQFAYHKGHLFLITPEDCHSFDVATTTGFFFIRFNDLFLKNNRPSSLAGAAWTRQMEYILQHARHEAGCLLKNQGDKALVNMLIGSIIKEQVNGDLFQAELVGQLINTLLVIVARNLAMSLPEKVEDRTDGTAVQIIQYIQQHIYEPEKLRADVIGDQFGISPAYLGRYFKKHTGEGMQQYITAYKLKLVETRLQHSDMRVSEIVSELGFTDESHLNKLFKKHKGVNPTSFRRMNSKETHATLNE